MTPPAHWFQQPVSGGVVTLTRTFHASASASLPQDDKSGSMTMGCSFGGYTVAIHAQPHDFRLGPFSDPQTGKSYPTGTVDDENGQLFYNYIWDSTDGNLNDLTKSVVYEHIDNTGNSTGKYSTTASGVAQYAPVNPPFNATVVATYDQPDPSGANPTSGTAGSQHDVLIRPSLLKPSAAGTFIYSSTQNWLFNDSLTGQTGVKLLGPLTITRTVTGSPMTSWVYTVSKGGSSASYTIP